MRGGNTDAAIVIGDGPIESPPTITDAWSAIVMHHEYWPSVRDNLADKCVVMLNSSVFAGEVDRANLSVLDVPATALAVEVGNVMAATMVMVGAYAIATNLVEVESLVSAISEALPPYRTQHRALNEAAIRIGAKAVAA